MAQTFTEEQVKEIVDKAIAEYEEKMNLKPLKEQLDAEIASLATAKEEFDKTKAEFTSEVEKFNTEKDSYISKADYDTKINEAVTSAVALNERYHNRLAKFSSANIKLDEKGLEKLRNEDDESIEWLYNQIVSAMKVEKPAESEGTPNPPATASVKTPPVGVNTDETEVNKYEVIGKILRKKLDSTHVE